ncbi:Immunoglobulin-like domain [Trinorchestia longiramus]|nr:Immunoglobulin-like domain [Trinorchestia longiramus]
MDAGRYECQVSSAPPMGHFVSLNIKEPQTKILGGPDIHINLGSTLNLTCLVLYHQHPPDVTWLHQGEMVGYQSARGGVNVVTESGEATKSSLLIQRAALSDAGTYTCRPNGGRSDSVTAHVLSEKKPRRGFLHTAISATEGVFGSSSSSPWIEQRRLREQF